MAQHSSTVAPHEGFLASRLRRLGQVFVIRPISWMFPRWYNKHFCSIEGLWDPYFSDVEPLMDAQWNDIIWPEIKDFDFRVALELAPGAGRNTERLARIAGELHAVDMNEYAMGKLRSRFAAFTGPCRMHFHVNSGSDLRMIPSHSVTSIYSWDAMVHFEKSIVRDYIREFSRVLKPGGYGFVHHSNLGSAAHANAMDNPSWRSNMSKELFVQYGRECGLEIVRQTALPWETVVDCLTVFKKS
jgi:SAM-dependent methyltransferase